MKRPNITPGPWTAYGPGAASDSSETWEIEDAFGHTATIYGDGDEAKANARAIAVVPELLSALLELHEYTRTASAGYRNALTPQEDELFTQVHAALLKAGYTF
jgi:hypothetical protein